MKIINYSILTYNSPVAVHRWFHSHRFKDAIRLLDVKAGDRILDFGCGDGRLLELIDKRYDDIKLVGYEPVVEMIEQASARIGNSVEIIDNPKFLKNQFNKIACLETCEHLPETELQELFSIIKEKATNSAIIVFSVPIETGLPGGMKNFYRKLRGDKKDQMSFRNLFKTFFGLKIDRSSHPIAEELNYYYSHVGFNHASFAQVLKSQFQITKVVFSPFNLFPGFANTVFYICRLKI